MASHRQCNRLGAVVCGLLCSAAAAHGETRKACAVLPARSTGPSASKLDTARIQDALNRCNPGFVVVLRKDGSRTAFVSAPLTVPRGVTLLVDKGVTLYAATERREYDLPVESPLAAKCRPFVYAYQAAFSGVDGEGTIDGQGAAWRGKEGCLPDLVSSYESQGFRLAGVTLRNAAGAHAMILKTTAPVVDGVRITADSPGAAGMVLSNATGGTVRDLWIRGPGTALEVKPNILGPTTGVRIEGVHVFGGGISVTDASVRDVHFRNVCGAAVAVPDGRTVDVQDAKAACAEAAFPPAPKVAWEAAAAKSGTARRLVVASDGTGAFRSVQKAVDALLAGGGEIVVRPGTYREVVTIRKPHVHVHGEGDPARTIVVYNNGAFTAGGTFNTSTVFVEADDVTLDHLTLSNDLGPGKGQGVALHVTGDRAAFRNLRILGAQDTLFAASRYCYGDYGPCVSARQYFADSYIEGNTDFIFGDSQAVFERCELHGIPSGTVMYTAHGRHTAEQKESGYVFDHCRLTGAARAGGVLSFGRPWRPYATVVFLDTQIDAPLIEAGWTEWARFGNPSLPTAFYAEYGSKGPGANPARRQLTDAEAGQWRGWGWRPTPRALREP